MRVMERWSEDVMKTARRQRSSSPHHLIPPSQSGQGVVEYAVLMAVLVAALIGMTSYIQRSLAGRWREVGDTFGYGRQYEPGVTTVTTVRQ